MIPRNASKQDIQNQNQTCNALVSSHFVIRNRYTGCQFDLIYFENCLCGIQKLTNGNDSLCVKQILRIFFSTSEDLPHQNLLAKTSAFQSQFTIHHLQIIIHLLQIIIIWACPFGSGYCAVTFWAVGAQFFKHLLATRPARLPAHIPHAAACSSVETGQALSHPAIESAPLLSAISAPEISRTANVKRATARDCPYTATPNLLSIFETRYIQRHVGAGLAPAQLCENLLAKMPALRAKSR